MLRQSGPPRKGEGTGDMRKIGPIVICALVAAFALAGTALGASSHARGEVRSSVIGSVPNTVLAGVPSGGAPWTVENGEARLRGDGEVDVKIAGLLLINTGIPGLDGTT